MQKRVKHLTVAYLIFLLLLSLSSSIKGVASEVVYQLSFIAPVFVLLTCKDELSTLLDAIKIKKHTAEITVLALAPTLAVITVLAYYTAALIYATTGKTDITDIGDSPLLAILNFALVPAISEEILFRLLPLVLIGKRNGRACIILSSVIFALAHFSPFQLVYAFVAGVIFMTVDLMTGSLWPSIILHFLNNLLSVIVLLYGDNNLFNIMLNVSICLLLCLSCFMFVRKRKILTAQISSAFSAKEGYGIEPTPLLFIIPAAIVGAVEFLNL